MGEEKEEEIVGEENQSEPEDDMFFGEEDKPGEDLTDAEDLLSDEQITETDSGEEQEEEGVGDEDVKNLLDDDEDLPVESLAVEETPEVSEAGSESTDESEDSIAEEEELEEATVEDSSSDETEELPSLEEVELGESDEATAYGAEDAGGAVEELTGKGSAPDAESALPDPSLVQAPAAQAAESQEAGTELLLHFHHEVRVEVARTHLSGEEITKITNGSIIVLDKVAGEPVAIVFDDKVIAQGEVVLINKDQLGIRIIGIVHN